jgi:soluble lytic murein transglycosylase
VSPAGARGLMQLMPDVGRALWRARGTSGTWSTALLSEPEVNLALGMRHLRAALVAWPNTSEALAAYNAGGSRVRRWRTAPGAASDPELFVERIPYEETRDYVRIILRSRDLYQALYPELAAAR